MNKEVLAIIPARGGSKGVPRKNIKKLGGNPLITYTIKTALNSKVDRVVLSTDDKEIADISEKEGVEVPFIRPDEFAQDDSSTLSVILHCLDWLKKEEDYSPDLVVILQPTSPFRKSEHINEGLDKMKECDGVVGVGKVKEHPYYMFKKSGEYLESFSGGDKEFLRRQNLESVFYLNGALYIVPVDYYENIQDPDLASPLPGKSAKVKGVFMDEISSLDIDSPLDFIIAQSIIKSDEYKNR